MVGFLSGKFIHPVGTLKVYDCVVTVECHDLILNAGWGYNRKRTKFEVVGMLVHTPTL